MGVQGDRRGARDGRKRKASTSTGSGLELIKNGSIGAGAALLFATVFLFLGTALCLSAKDPNSMIAPVGYLSSWLAALLGGILAVRLNRGGALPCGAVCGALFVLFFWVLSLFYDRDTATLPFGLSLVFRLITVLSSVLGALIGSKRRTSPRRRKRS